uniref:Uncharacterized protein n=1 Tax=Anguilla anguilla TaxID=7936 RepID=A0A0E9SBU7_ANGAN
MFLDIFRPYIPQFSPLTFSSVSDHREH